MTKVFSNDSRADWLLGVRPSVLSVVNAAAIAANWLTVVPDAISIVSTSFRSVCKAVESVELDELLEVLVSLLLLTWLDAVVAALVEEVVAALVLVVVDSTLCVWVFA